MQKNLITFLFTILQLFSIWGHLIQKTHCLLFACFYNTLMWINDKSSWTSHYLFSQGFQGVLLTSSNFYNGSLMFFPKLFDKSLSIKFTLSSTLEKLSLLSERIFTVPHYSTVHVINSIDKTMLFCIRVLDLFNLW